MSCIFTSLFCILYVWCKVPVLVFANLHKQKGWMLKKIDNLHINMIIKFNFDICLLVEDKNTICHHTLRQRKRMLT